MCQGTKVPCLKISVTSTALFNKLSLDDKPSAMGYFAVTSKVLTPGSSLRSSLDPSGTTIK